MSQNIDQPQKPLPASDKIADPRKEHDAGKTASHRLYSEASQEWSKEAAEARKAPLSVPDGQHYHVKAGDTLSDIAARRLRADHLGVNAHSIAKEESRLRKLNSSEHASFGSQDSKHRNSIQAGWDLKIYDSVHDKKAAPASTGDVVTGKPRINGDNDKSNGISREVASKIASQLNPADLAAIDAALSKSRVARPGDASLRTEPEPKVAEKPSGTGTAPDLSQVPLPPERPKEFPRVSGDDVYKPHGDMSPRKYLSPAETPEPKEKPGRLEKREDLNGASPEGKLDRTRFYQHQMNGWSCSATALAMMYSNEETGHKPTPGDLEHFERVTGTTQHGYRGSLADMAAQARSQGLEAKPYQYGSFGEQGMNDLDRELAMGHSAVARIINPHTGHPHYIYVAGRTSDGKYVVGDPDRHNNPTFGHDQPITRRHLEQMMSGRDGFVAGWAS
jgi:LysM repeat protein